MTDEKTCAVYDNRAADYAAKAEDWGARHPQRDKFIADCPPGGAVLDLGAGPGIDARVMAAAGLHVTAWDASCEMVALANAQPGVTAVQAGFGDLRAEAEFDGIWASFSLLHAPRADMPRHLAAIHRALRPGGVFWIGVKLGTGEGRDEIGRFYSYYQADELGTLLAAAGFVETGREFGSGVGLAGTMSEFVWIAARA